MYDIHITLNVMANNDKAPKDQPQNGESPETQPPGGNVPPGQDNKPDKETDKEKADREKKEKDKKVEFDKIRETLPDRQISRDEIIQFFHRFIEEQGYVPDRSEVTKGGFTIIRIKSPGGQVISSTSFPATLVNYPMDQVAVGIKAQVLEALDVAMQEPALKQERRR